MAAQMVTLETGVKISNGLPYLYLRYVNPRGNAKVKRVDGMRSESMNGAYQDLISRLPNDCKGRADDAYHSLSETLATVFARVEHDRLDLNKLMVLRWGWKIDKWVSQNDIYLLPHISNFTDSLDSFYWGLSVPFGKGRTTTVDRRSVRACFTALDNLVLSVGDIRETKFPGPPLSEA